MPATFNVANGIIEAYLAGLNLKRQREQDTLKKQQDVQERQDKLDAQKEATRQFEEKLKQEQGQFDLRQRAVQVANELAAEEARVKFKTGMQETGDLPPSYKYTSRTTEGLGDPNYYGQETSDIAPIDPNSTLPVIKGIKDPVTYANQQAELERIRTAPKNDAALRIKQVEETFKAYQDQQTHEARLKEIALQNQGRLEAARLNKTSPEETKRIARESALDTPFDPKVQLETFGRKTYDPNFTPRAAGGSGIIKPLTPAQLDKLNDFKELERQTVKLQGLLDAKDKDGIVNYEKFYKGRASGTVANIKSAFYEDPKVINEINQLAASIESQAKNLIGKYGGALTTNEQLMLEKQAPSPSRTLLPGRAKAIVDGFLDQLKNRQKETIEKTPEQIQKEKLAKAMGLEP